MDIQVEKHATDAIQRRRLLQELWARSVPKDALRRLSLRSELLAPLDGEEGFTDRGTLLAELLALFGGERAFVFTVTSRPGAHSEIGDCLASRDLDGDAVSNADRKVPGVVLAQAAETMLPFYRAWNDPSAEHRPEGSLLVLPGLSRGAVRLVFVIENRFRDLDVDEENVLAARAYCSRAALLVDFETTLDENGSLWKDITRLQSEGPRAVRSGATQEAPRARITHRRGLKGDYSIIVGSSVRVLEILQVIDRISASTAPVLINGESGTGKELVALAVHENSPRRGKPFVSENCAAITETLLESELFGYVRGAFTGANKDNKGLFEVADGGTLFLDEVGDMSPSMQKKLLRVLQEGVIRRVGAKESTPVDVRIISATNKDLLTECRQGNFREDLYYRLNVVNLRLPPLRERREDIPELAQFFLEHSSKGGKPAPSLEPEVLDALVEYSWPGNVRELQNEIRRLCALAEGDVIRLSDLSGVLLEGELPESVSSGWLGDLSRMTLREATELVERELIRRALREAGGNKSLVAKALQIPKTSLYNKIQKYGLSG